MLYRIDQFIRTFLSEFDIVRLQEILLLHSCGCQHVRGLGARLQDALERFRGPRYAVKKLLRKKRRNSRN